MNKKIKVIKNDGKIVMFLNDSIISDFSISQNKINGKELFEKLDIQKEDIFTLEPHGVANDSKDIEDIVLINTHEFLGKVVERVNNKLIELLNR